MGNKDKNSDKKTEQKRWNPSVKPEPELRPPPQTPKELKPKEENPEKRVPKNKEPLTS